MPQLQDYYFSQLQKNIIMQTNKYLILDHYNRGKYVRCFVTIDGVEHEFTEQIEHGKKPSNWDDMKFLGTGELDKNTRYE